MKIKKRKGTVMQIKFQQLHYGVLTDKNFFNLLGNFKKGASQNEYVFQLLGKLFLRLRLEPEIKAGKLRYTLRGISSEASLYWAVRFLVDSIRIIKKNFYLKLVQEFQNLASDISTASLALRDSYLDQVEIARLNLKEPKKNYRNYLYNIRKLARSNRRKKVVIRRMRDITYNVLQLE